MGWDRAEEWGGGGWEAGDVSEAKRTALLPLEYLYFLM